MAWRPTEYLLEGELNNTTPGRVTGWMRFAGIEDKVTFDLAGNFHRDIRGAKIRFTGGGIPGSQSAARFMEGFATQQTGKAGDITAGLPPQDYGPYPYVEWYSDQNGRVVLEFERQQIHVIGTPIPAIESDPVSRQEQAQNMGEFLTDIAKAAGLPQQNVICVPAVKRQPRTDHPGHQLMPEDLRMQLPLLYSQENKGGKAIAYAKYFTPDSGFTWLALEFDGNDTFFGLVDGQFKELGYFSLSELESVRGPMGLPVERDVHWKPTPLQEIAPELFRKEARGGEA